MTLKLIRLLIFLISRQLERVYFHREPHVLFNCLLLIGLTNVHKGNLLLNNQEENEVFVKNAICFEY